MLAVLCFGLALACASSSAAAAVHPAPQVFWKDTPLDWFRFTLDAPLTFRQRVLFSDKYWDKPSGPLLVFFGGEGICEDFWDNSGALFDMAQELKAKVVFLEHRYYGRSLPFGADSYDSDNLKYLTVEQALADMSDLLYRKQELLGCHSDAGSCDAVLFGGSYGGMQAAWHRLKYPHLSVGALAASAPVDIYPGEHKSEVFLDAWLYTYRKYGSRQCAAWVRRALDRLVAYKNPSMSAARTKLLSSTFATCSPISTSGDVARLLMYVNGALSSMAMVDYPFKATFVTPMPASPVKYACDLAGQPPSPTAGPGDNADDEWLFKSLNTLQNVFLNFTNQLGCHNTSAELLAFQQDSDGRPHLKSTPPTRAMLRVLGGLGDITRPWNYMACSSLILEPLTSNGYGFSVPTESQIPAVEQACQATFKGIRPRPSWSPMAYGNGIQLASNLRNVFFSDGDKDPWRIGGMPDNSSAYSVDGSVVRLLIYGAAHHQDLRSADATDSVDLLAARRTELEYVRKWLRKASG